MICNFQFSGKLQHTAGIHSQTTIHITTDLIGTVVITQTTGKETVDGHRMDSLDDVNLRVLADDIPINVKVFSNFLLRRDKSNDGL